MRTVLALLLALAPAAALADACDTVKASFERLATAQAVQQTMSIANMPPMQVISIGEEMYMSQDGSSWMKLPPQPGGRAASMQAMIPESSALSDCRETDSEDIGGTATTIYEYLPPSFAGETPSVQKLWIGDADGMPYRMTTVVDGTALEIGMVYEGVVAPIQ
jgi:hypothetical protein